MIKLKTEKKYQRTELTNYQSKWDWGTRRGDGGLTLLRVRARRRGEICLTRNSSMTFKLLREENQRRYWVNSPWKWYSQKGKEVDLESLRAQDRTTSKTHQIQAQVKEVGRSKWRWVEMLEKERKERGRRARKCWGREEGQQRSRRNDLNWYELL